MGFLACAHSLVSAERQPEEARSSEDESWRAVVTACEDSAEGKAIRGRRISGDQRLCLRALLHPRAWAAADLAAAYRHRNPSHPNSVKALRMELEQMVWAGDVAVSTDTRLFARTDLVVREWLSESKISEKERFNLAAAALGRMTYARFNGLTNETDLPAFLDAELRDAQFLHSRLPNVSEVWDLYQLIAGQLPPDKARPVLEEMLRQAPPGRARSKAEGLQWRLDAVGKPFVLTFRAVDGRAVDTKEWQGKVILIDFWATWCAPCMAEMPAIREVYNRFHARGFEIVGVSLDTDKASLERCVARYSIPWPQSFDGQGWEGPLLVRYGVSLIPTLWLVDKQGVLRFLDARDNLASKVEMLLKEP